MIRHNWGKKKFGDVNQNVNKFTNVNVRLVSQNEP